MESVKRSSVVITASGHVSEPLHMYYLKNFVSACRLSMQRVFTTDKGALTQVPFVELDHVIKNQGRKAPDISPAARSRQYERYLARINCFVINFRSGDAFIEVNDPISDVTNFMNMKNRDYKCNACAAVVANNNDNDATGVECPACKNGKLERVNPCDVKENLKRIQSMIDYVKEIS